MSNENLGGAKAAVQEAMLREGTALALDEKKQSAVLGHVFNPETKMFTYLVGIAEKNWWSNPMHGVIWGIIQEWHKKHGCCPTVEEILGYNGLQVRDTAEVTRIRGLLSNAKADTQAFKHGPLRNEIQTWMHAKILQNIYVKGSHLWNSTKFEESAEVIADGLKYLKATQWLDTVERKLTDIREIAADLGPRGVVCFGLDGVDEHLFEESKDGGLRRCDQTVVMASVNSGKTTTLITVAIHNIRANRDVLFVSHEGHRSDLRLKMIRCYLSLVEERDLLKFLKWLPESQDDGRRARNYIARSPQVVVEKLRRIGSLKLIGLVMYMTQENHPTTEERIVFRIFGAALECMQAHMTFLPIHGGALTVEDVSGHIERAQEVWKDTHVNADGNPKGYDLFVSDYPGVLTTRQNTKGNLEWRIQQKVVYDHFVQLALQHEWHSLVAIQTNREGAKINAGTFKYGEKRFLTNEDVSECWGAIMSAANVITVNRSPTAQMANRLTFFISKSRSSPTSFAVTCYSNFACGVTHANELGYVGYYGTTENKGVLSTYKLGERRVLSIAETTALASTVYEEETSEKKS